VTPSPPNDPLSLQLADFNKNFNINTVSAFVAAQQAAIGFAQLPDSTAKTFIYTGNILNTIVSPRLLDLGVGKAATAHIIQSAAAAYKDRGYKYANFCSLVSKRLTVVGSTMATSARRMVRLSIAQSTGMRTRSYIWSWLRERHRDLGSRHSSRGRDTRTFPLLDFRSLDRE